MNESQHTQSYTFIHIIHIRSQQDSAEFEKDVASVGCFISTIVKKKLDFFVSVYMHVNACACDWGNVADCLVKTQRAPLCS